MDAWQNGQAVMVVATLSWQPHGHLLGSLMAEEKGQWKVGVSLLSHFALPESALATGWRRPSIPSLEEWHCEACNLWGLKKGKPKVAWLYSLGVRRLIKCGQAHSLETPGLSLSLLCFSTSMINSLQEISITPFPKIYYFVSNLIFFLMTQK